MGNKQSSSENLISNNNYKTSNHCNLEGLGEFMVGTDLETQETYLILITSYQISNKELVESELTSLD